MRKRVPAIGLALGLALGGVGACARGGPAPDLRAPAMRGLASPSCGGCHEAERTAWDVSMHHASFSSEDFQSSYREEPSTFCVDCHAPLGRKLGTATAYAHGIGCESCHPASSEHAKGPVAVRATTSPCAPCHEFESERARTFLQSTEHEHRASRYRDTSCIDCHMARSDAGTRDHRFDVSRNPGVLSRALFVGAPRREADYVAFVLRGVAVGHRFPTGDIFRRLQVRAWIEDERGRILADQDFALNRDWDAHRAARSPRVRAVEHGDTRLDDDPRELRVPLDVTRGASIRLFVRVDYQRGFEARGGRLQLFSTLRIAEREFRL
jgi:hypothetical protein